MSQQKRQVMTSVGTRPLPDKSPNGFLTFSLQENKEENGREVGIKGRDERLCHFAGDFSGVLDNE